MKRVKLTILTCVFLIVTFAALAGRCFYLQFFKADHYVAAATRQQQKWDTEKPQRGVILDRQGRLLAASNKIQTIFAEPRRISRPEQVATELAPVLHIGARQIYEKIIESKNPGFARLLTEATPQQCDAARKIDNGIGFQSEWR
ncbi:MAG: hypothetical protein PVG93_05635, partial [Phycisphaerales bacterium]